MRRTEKILIALVVVILLLRLWPIFSWGYGLLLLATWLLGLTYIFGGNRLFNIEGEHARLVPALAGIAFGTALLPLPFTVSLRQELIYSILPSLNALFLLGLILYIVVKRREDEVVVRYRPLLIRSALIFLVVGFFTYLTPSSSAYRAALKAFNSADDRLVSNVEMFEHSEKFKEAFLVGDCQNSIIHAERAVDEGLKWLGYAYDKVEEWRLAIDSKGYHQVVSRPHRMDVFHQGDDGREEPDLQPMRGAFIKLYEAYECWANELYHKGDIEKSLDYYLMADDALKRANSPVEYWRIEQAYSKNNMALCHKALDNFDLADSLYLEAISTYQDITDTTDRNVAGFYVNLAISMSAQGHLEYSNVIYQLALDIYDRDTTYSDDQSTVLVAYSGLIQNNLQLDSLDVALRLIETALDKVDDDVSYRGLFKLLEGVAYYQSSDYKRADASLNEGLSCHRKLGGSVSHNLASNLRVLSLVKLARAQYDSARVHIDEAMNVASPKYSADHVEYAAYLWIRASIDKELGFYHQAELDYNRLIATYSNDSDQGAGHLVKPLMDLALLKTDLGDYVGAKTISDRAMSIAEVESNLKVTSVTPVFNMAAYVNYCFADIQLADSLYHTVLRIERKRPQSASVAYALNGLGLLALDERQYAVADSLFRHSLQLYEGVFSPRHPSIASVQVNLALLNIEENEFDEAEALLNSAMSIYREYFDPHHDAFADIAVGFGDLAVKRRRPESARSHYQNAIDIYSQKFDSEHPELLAAKVKLSRLTSRSAQ